MWIGKPGLRYVTAMFGLVAIAGEAAERQGKTATVESGAEVLVYGHKNWDKGCRPMPVPEIKITRPPATGAIALRPGTFRVDGSWHPDADQGCKGRSFPGIGVYYKANPGSRGVDTFEYDVTLGGKRPITYGVDARITVK